MSGDRRQVRVIYDGEVQGVGFRYTARGIATRLGATGGAENLPDGTVRLVAEGPEDVLRQFLLQIRVSHLGPRISNEKVDWGEAQGLEGFYYR